MREDKGKYMRWKNSLQTKIETHSLFASPRQCRKETVIRIVTRIRRVQHSYQGARGSRGRKNEMIHVY